VLGVRPLPQPQPLLPLARRIDLFLNLDLASTPPPFQRHHRSLANQ
jgi:hypothetical protein